MLSGRRAQARTNDQRILDAARVVFGADPEAPIAEVASLAGVGISALYRRYRSKEELLQRLARDALSAYIALLEAALADPGDPWAGFCSVMQGTVAVGTSPLSLRCDGLEMRARALTAELLDRLHQAHAVRPEVSVTDIAVLLDLLHVVRPEHLRHRYMMLLLDALHFLSLQPLPGPPPDWDEMWRGH